MFPLGYVLIGDYEAWITTPVFTVEPHNSEAGNLPYYEVLLHKQINGYCCYVNPIKEIFKWEMTDRNPLARPKDKENPTPDEVEFRIEAHSYNDRKDMGMPLIKLSRKHVGELLQRLCQ